MKNLNLKNNIFTEKTDIEFNDDKPLNWNGRHDAFKNAFNLFIAERIDAGKSINLSTGDEYIDFFEAALVYIQDALVKHAIEFGDEYVLKCYGLLPVDATRVNELIAQRDKHALKFFGLESSSEDELNNWDANNLEKLPLVKDFEEDFKPIQPIYDKWNVYHPDYDNC